VYAAEQKVRQDMNGRFERVDQHLGSLDEKLTLILERLPGQGA
jgi:hypothetical protein